MISAIILPDSWYEEASIFIAGLNSLRPRYFLITFPESPDFKSKSYLSSVGKLMASNQAFSAMHVVPKCFASGDKIDLWPSLIQSHSDMTWVSSLFFADSWEEVATALGDFSEEEENPDDFATHLTCQYQPSYTDILSQWANEGRNTYHPGDFFKEDILSAISQMRGNWLYWGHGEGDKLRGYSHLHTVDLLAHKCSKQLNSTLWFTCCTLDRNYPENIALAWYLSGATKCIFASPEKVNTESNKLLSEVWLEIAKIDKEKTVSSVILDVLWKNPEVFEKILNQYFLLGIPWVKGNL